MGYEIREEHDFKTIGSKKKIIWTYLVLMWKGIYDIYRLKLGELHYNSGHLLETIVICLISETLSVKTIILYNI